METFSSRTRVNGGLRYRDNSASFLVGEEETLKLSNRGLALRLGGRYKWLGYTFSIPVSDLGTDSEVGNARSLGLNLQFYRDKFYLNANGRRTIGFEQRRIDEEVSFRDDIRFFNVLVFGFRVLNSRHFSLGSSFKQHGRQLKSSGSLLVGGAINRQVLLADSLRLPFNRQGEVVIERYAQSKITAGLGYAHTFVIARDFFLTPLAVAGPEMRFITYDPRGASRQIEKNMVSVRVRGRLALGYNGRRNYTALTVAYLPSIDNTENLDTRVDETRIELTIGHRFNVAD
ncbi:hypothetical protein GGR26_001092 [Lewinella marina]|uniref:DUF4421 family protein n=1 Tax=Neolewinella marina TaxID=438751 RepID=UPI001431170F|nr:DUF4421 family protein [Neolewinella marina]NJB85347.1 hypothetical protein [Neolewinella marina]